MRLRARGLAVVAMATTRGLALKSGQNASDQIARRGLRLRRAPETLRALAEARSARGVRALGSR